MHSRRIRCICGCKWLFGAAISPWLVCRSQCAIHQGISIQNITTFGSRIERCQFSFVKTVLPRVAWTRELLSTFCHLQMALTPSQITPRRWILNVISLVCSPRISWWISQYGHSTPVCTGGVWRAFVSKSKAWSLTGKVIIISATQSRYEVRQILHPAYSDVHIWFYRNELFLPVRVNPWAHLMEPDTNFERSTVERGPPSMSPTTNLIVG